MNEISPLFQSTVTDQLMLALMNMHKEHGVIIGKDKKGHKGTYASLPCILESIHKMCSQHGLILTQASRIINGQTALETILRHPASGQWIACQSLLTPNPEAQSYDQAWGGSSTYHRRYDAMMLLGIFSEDDPTDHDGNITVVTHEKKSSRITQKQLDLLLAKINGDEHIIKKICETLRISSLVDIPWKEFNKVLNYVEKTKFEKLIPFNKNF